MHTASNIDEKFDRTCFTMKEEYIYLVNEIDGGILNNVISFICKDCYGVQLIDDPDGLTIEFFYVTNEPILKGDILVVNADDEDRIALLWRFCQLLVSLYPDLDTIDCFNTFQSNLQTYLQKYGYQTVTNFDIDRFGGKDATLVSFSKKGFRLITFIDKIKYFREYFSKNYKSVIDKNLTYVYLMVNVDTSLIKIGFSNDPSYRERTLHSKEPSVHLIALWQADKSKEKLLHNHFQDKRRRGEWFKLDLLDLQYIKQHMDSSQ